VRGWLARKAAVPRKEVQYAVAKDPVHAAYLNPKEYTIYWKDQVPYMLDGQMEFAGDYYDAEKGNLQTQTDKEEAKLTNLIKKVLQTKGMKPEHALGVAEQG
jgi:hypothetical protein